jgi:antitoxin HicB
MGTTRNKHLGSSFEDFLEEDGILEDVTAAALKRVFAWQLQQKMKEHKITQQELAARMHTSRTVVRRLLKEDDTSITLATMSRASIAAGMPFTFSFG